MKEPEAKSEAGGAQGIKQVYKDLRRAEQRFRVTVESAPTGMVMVDRHGVIALVNAETERLFGYRREELLGQRVERLVPATFREPHPQLRAAFVAAPQARRMGAGRDLFAVRKDGSEMPVAPPHHRSLRIAAPAATRSPPSGRTARRENIQRDRPKR